MTTRRDFIASAAGAFAGAAFCGCGLLEHAYAQPAARRREVVVNGRRVKTVDVHAHCVFPGGHGDAGPEVAAAQSRRRRRPLQGHGRAGHRHGGDQHQSRSGTRPTATSPTKLIKLQNEKLAELVAAHPDRFVAFATVAMQHPDLAVAAARIRHQEARPARHVGRRQRRRAWSSSDPKFHPIWAKCEELGILVFIHPVGTKELSPRLKGNGGLENTIGNPLETTLALSHLIYEGTLDRFPGLKICAAHGGGYLPFYAPRSDAICVTFPDRCASVPLKKKPTEYLQAALLRLARVHARGAEDPDRRGRRRPAS